MEKPRYQLVLTTCPTPDTATAIARTLVEERLAACVNILPTVHSIYRWRGQVESAQEQMLLAKTRVADYAAIEQRIRALHSYELPEIIAVPIAAGLTAYLAWIEDPERTE